MHRPSWIVRPLAKEPYASCLALPYSFFRKALDDWGFSQTAMPHLGRLPKRSRTRAPSLHRNYPAPSVPWAPPTSTTARDWTFQSTPVGGRDPPPPWISHVASKTFCACSPHYPGWRERVLRSVAPPPPDGLPLLTGGSAPARNYRGLLRVHVLFGLRICTSVAPKTSPEASGGRFLTSPAPVATGRTDNSPDGTPTRWSSRPRRSLRNLTSAHVRPPFVPHCQRFLRKIHPRTSPPLGPRSRGLGSLNSELAGLDFGGLSDTPSPPRAEWAHQNAFHRRVLQSKIEAWPSYPATNGKAGGKQPAGKGAVRSPRRSFSAASRKAPTNQE